jgi:hypothetical protein
MARAIDRNIALIALGQDFPDDVFIAGVIVVTLDQDGNYGTVFKAESLDDLPIPELQEELGHHITTAWEMANTPGIHITEEHK